MGKMKDLMEQRGLSINELATLASVSRGTVRDLMNGTGNVGIVNILKIASVLDVPFQNLVDEYLNQV